LHQTLQRGRIKTGFDYDPPPTPTATLSPQPAATVSNFYAANSTTTSPLLPTALDECSRLR